MILCNLYGKGLEPLSSNGVAGMLFCPQCAKNCRKLLANGQGLHLDAVPVGRAMDEARSGFVKITEIVNKILEEREMASLGFWCRLPALVLQGKQGGR